MKTALLVIVLFILLILPHEFGHFITAKLFGVTVNEFAFGMGPTLLKKKKGDTTYSWRLFPIGGFCSMADEDGLSTEEGKEEHGFFSKKPWQKLIILAAGSVMNVVTAVVALFIVFVIIGTSTLNLATVTQGSPADLAGLQANDRIVAVDGVTVSDWSSAVTAIQDKNGETVAITVNRKGEELTYDVTPDVTETTDSDGNVTTRFVVGITCKISHNPFIAIKDSVQMCWTMYKATFVSLVELIGGKYGINDISGPVGIVKVVNDSVSYGIYYYICILALLCLNLAIVNLLPLPALDGGRIIFVIYSWITKKPVSPKVEGTVHGIGMVILLAFSALIAVKDVFQLFN